MIPSDISNFPEYQDLYKNIYAKVLLSIGIPITAFLGIYHLTHSRYIPGGLVMGMFLSLCCILYDFIKTSEVRKSELLREITIRIFHIFFVFSQLYGIAVKQSISTPPWFMVFPLLIFFSTNIKEALIWSSFVALILFYSLFFTEPPTNPDEIFQLKTRLIVIYGIMVFITLIISVNVKLVTQKLFDNAKVVQGLNLRLKKEIEEHKQAEETLRKNEEKFRLLTENANDMIWTMDVDLNFDYISPAIEKLLGWSSQEAVSLTINDLLTPQSIDLAFKRSEAAQAQGMQTGNYDITERIELQANCKDGAVIWTETSASFILGANGKPVLRGPSTERFTALNCRGRQWSRRSIKVSPCRRPAGQTRDSPRCGSAQRGRPAPRDPKKT